MCTKFHEKTLKGSEKIEERILNNWSKNTPKWPSAEKYMMWIKNNHSSATNISTKFHDKISNDSQEKEEHTPEWAPGWHGMKEN